MENTNFKYSWGKFYWDAWLNDINLQSCDLAVQGLWINLIALMHKSEQIGYLMINGRPMTVFDIAKRVGIRKDRTERLLKKLIDNDVCSVNDDGVLYCRRIVREEKRRGRFTDKNSLETVEKKDDNLLNYRLKSQREQDVINAFPLCKELHEKRQNVITYKNINDENIDYKTIHKIKYELVGSRLPKGWVPDMDHYQYAENLQLCPEEVIEDFRDYWHAKAGKEAIKVDWNAAWRRWCRVAYQWQKKNKNHKKKIKMFLLD